MRKWREPGWRYHSALVRSRFGAQEQFQPGAPPLRIQKPSLKTQLLVPAALWKTEEPCHEGNPQMAGV